MVSLTLIAWTATAVAVDVPSADVHHATLDNGLDVYVERQSRTDDVALYLKYRVGSRDEVTREKGLAHLFEHLMFERSANVPQDSFDTWLTAAGGWNNAYTSPDETVYYEVFPSGALDLALFLESDRMGFLEAGLDTANLDNQRGVVLQERATGFDQPYGKVGDLLQVIATGPAHPYGVSTIGTVADIEGADIDLVRDFWRRHYRARNATLVIVGNVDPDHALDRVRHWFSDVPDRGLPDPRPARPADHRFVPVDAVLEDDVEERTIALAWPAPEGGHPDAFALEVLASILSGARGTRLDDALYYRSNLATETGAWYDGSEIDGAFYLYAGSPTTPLPTLMARADAVLAKVVKKGVTDAEVARAVRNLVNGTLDATEAVDDRAATILTCVDRYGTPDCLGREVAGYQAVTAADVQRVARQILDPNRRSTLSIVPRGDDGALPGAVVVELP